MANTLLVSVVVTDVFGHLVSESADLTPKEAGDLLAGWLRVAKEEPELLVSTIEIPELGIITAP